MTDPIGIGNKLTGGANVTLGFLTVPVIQQIQNRLNSNGGKFKDDEIVFVMAGANDVFFQLGLLQAAATDPSTAISSVALAANQLATAINLEKAVSPRNTLKARNGSRRYVALKGDNSQKIQRDAMRLILTQWVNYCT